MKNLAVVLLTCVLFAGPNIASATYTSSGAFSFEQAKETKKEINVKKLPKEVTLDITENQNGATILKAYETYIDGEKNGYEVEIKKGNREATLTYDLKGNPVNRITPLKI